MIKGFFINFLGAACVAPLLLSAQDFTLGLPVDCDMETHCYIQQYMDHDPSKNASDMRCGPLTYDGHSGTDFAIRNPLKIPTGVNVIASAPGTIKALRDGIQDVPYSSNNANNVEGQECGNGVFVAHSGGWETQYCHLKMDQLRCVLVTLYNKDPCLGKLDCLDEHNFRMSTSVFAETAIALIPLLRAGAPCVTLHLKHFGANQ